MPKEAHRTDVQRMMAEGVPVIEVLPAEEYDAEHLPGAINLPLKHLTAEAANRFDKHRPLIVYCYDYQCDLSPRAAWRLETLGFTDVYHYTAGKADWAASGLPIEGTQSHEPSVGDRVRRDVPTCRFGERVGDVRNRVREADGNFCVVVNAANIVLGRLRGASLDAGDEKLVEEVMEEGPTTYRPNLPAHEAAHHLEERGVASVLVTTSEGELIGAFYRADVLSAERPSNI
jgi:rhodanese-related sulfurtransferase/CBS domain-containing protein